MNATATLTPREKQIAELLAWGGAKKEVADRLSISESTVANISRSVYEKLNIQKATELSVWFFCTTFRIPFNMSPLAKAIICAILMLAIIPNELMGVRSIRKAGRKSNIEIRARRFRRNDTLYLPEII